MPNNATRQQRLVLGGMLALALFLRLLYALAQNHDEPYWSRAGDSWWYLKAGYDLVTGTIKASLPTGPVYPLFVGFWQVVLSRTAAVIAIRVAQVGMGTAVCYLGYRIGRRLTGDNRVGLVVAGVLAVSPVFVMETAQVLTESLYVFLVAAGLWLYIEKATATASEQDNARPFRAVAAVGMVLGIATLTRAVLLLFPVGLALHLILLHGRRDGLKRAILLLTAYSLVLSTWTVYNWVRFNTVVIGAQGFSSFVYMGARGWHGPEATDAQLIEDVPDHVEQDPHLNRRQDAYKTAIIQTITQDPFGYARRRVGELVSAYLQPHGTVLFPGESLKAMTRDWITQNRSPRGLLDLMTGDWFFPKLVLYIFHYTGLVGGLVGMWLYRRHRAAALPLIGFILYTTLVHLVLMVTPRYIFPLEMVWWIFTGAALVAGWDAWRNRRRQQASLS